MYRIVLVAVMFRMLFLFDKVLLICKSRVSQSTIITVIYLNYYLLFFFHLFVHYFRAVQFLCAKINKLHIFASEQEAL